MGSVEWLPKRLRTAAAAVCYGGVAGPGQAKRFCGISWWEVFCCPGKTF